MAEAARRRQADRIAHTRAQLMAAARKTFAAQGYAATSMDSICAEAGLTRGALYHHFGGKEGLLEAVARQIDAEISHRLDSAYEAQSDPWLGFVRCCTLYLEMALDPEVQRILFRDAAVVLGERFRDIDRASAIAPTRDALAELMRGGFIHEADADALAVAINGAIIDAALWIAASAEPPAAFVKAEQAVRTLLLGLARTG